MISVLYFVTFFPRNYATSYHNYEWNTEAKSLNYVSQSDEHTLSVCSICFIYEQCMILGILDRCSAKLFLLVLLNPEVSIHAPD